jgi:hypothetical protein
VKILEDMFGTKTDHIHKHIRRGDTMLQKKVRSNDKIQKSLETFVVEPLEVIAVNKCRALSLDFQFGVDWNDLLGVQQPMISVVSPSWPETRACKASTAAWRRAVTSELPRSERSRRINSRGSSSN